jgi:hypothetical protein
MNMSRSEKLILVRAEPTDCIAALDAILATRGYQRAVTRAINEDFSPLLHETGDPLAFVFSTAFGDWSACFTSLAFAAEWEVAEELAVAIQQPLVHAVFDGTYAVYGYRYFDGGELREESLPEGDEDAELDEDGLLEILQKHGIAPELVDDRITGFGHEHLVVAYAREQLETVASRVTPRDLEPGATDGRLVD